MAQSAGLNEPNRLPLRALVGQYVRLTKPWILILLLITTFTAMLIAEGGLPRFGLIAAAMVGGALTAAGASAINSYIDSDIDGLMSRTRRRPVPQSAITPRAALVFGLLISAAGLGILWLGANWQAAALAALGNAYYVVIYTRWLKRSTPMNIVIGGLAGAIPPLVGWVAVTGTIDLLAIYLFLFIFFWTPPHTWALTLLVQKDYQRANIPMLNIVYGQPETYRQINLYLVQLIALTFLPFAFGLLGWVYGLLTVVLSVVFVVLGVRLWRARDGASARLLYKYSQSYLALLFLAMVIDRWGMV